MLNNELKQRSAEICTLMVKRGFWIRNKFMFCKFHSNLLCELPLTISAVLWLPKTKHTFFIEKHLVFGSRCSLHRFRAIGFVDLFCFSP